jgi:hypothetical protein
MAQFPARDFFAPTPTCDHTKCFHPLFFKMKIKGGKIATSQESYQVLRNIYSKKKLTTLQGKSIPPPPLFQLSINNCIDIFYGFRLSSLLIKENIDNITWWTV